MEKSFYYATEKELSYVINRFDIDLNGAITFAEFILELRPKIFSRAWTINEYLLNNVNFMLMRINKLNSYQKGKRQHNSPLKLLVGHLLLKKF